MNTRASDTMCDDDWPRLQRWSAGYDAGFARVVPDDFPADYTDQGEYVAGFAQGMKDRRAIDAELPPRG